VATGGTVRPYTPQQITAIIITVIMSLLTLTIQMEHEHGTRHSKKNQQKKRCKFRLEKVMAFPKNQKLFLLFKKPKIGKSKKKPKRQGYGPNDQIQGKQTLANLIDRYIAIILPTKPKDARNMKRHLDLVAR
jgi:cell division protein FtsN